MNLALPQLRPEEARLRNAVANAAERLALTLAGRERELRLLGEPATLGEPGARLVLLLDGHPLRLDFSAPLADAEALEAMGIASFASLPAPLRHLVTAKAVDADLDRFESWSGLQVRIGEDGGSPELEPVLSFELSGGLRGGLAAPPEALPLLAQLVERLPRREAALADQPIRLALEAGRTMLPASEVRALARGDVVLVDRGPELGRGALEFRAGRGLLYRATLSGTALTIDAIMTVDPEPDEAPESEEAPASFDSLPVELVFELGRRQITFAELQELQPGSTLVLEEPLERSAVTVRANGKVIGRGELVQVGDRIGVRLR